MKEIFFLVVAVVFINGANAQINPPQKAVTNKNTVPLGILKTDTTQSKTVRFSAGTYGDMQYGIPPDSNMNYSIRYNTNTNAVTINKEEIVIKKSGLYHFECFLSSKVYGPNARIHPLFSTSMKVNGDIYTLLSDKIMPLAQISDEKLSYFHSELFSLDLYIKAPSIIKITKKYYAPFARAIDIYTQGWFTGYLMEE